MFLFRVGLARSIFFPHKRSDGRSATIGRMSGRSVALPSPRAGEGGVGASANKPVAEPVAVGLDPSRGWVRKMDRQHEGVGPGDLAEKSPARVRRLHAVPVE